MARVNAYLLAGAELLRESGCTVRKYRTSNSGRAFTYSDDWGIEAPEPRGPVSFYVFAHEIAHHMLHRGNGNYPRWLEEIEADEYALAQFARFDLDGYIKARDRAAGYLCYSLWKAARRCSAETAQAILDRAPEWTWGSDWWRCIETLARLAERAKGVVVP